MGFDPFGPRPAHWAPVGYVSVFFEWPWSMARSRSARWGRGGGAIRTIVQLAGIGLVTVLGTISIAFLQAPSMSGRGDRATPGLAQLDVGSLACDPSLPDGPEPEALQGRLRTVSPTFMPCLAGATPSPRDTLRLKLTVECSGVVAEISVVDAGDWPSVVVSCTREALSRARFPAHGLASGYTFDFPVRYTAARADPVYGSMLR